MIMHKPLGMHKSFPYPVDYQRRIRQPWITLPYKRHSPNFFVGEHLPRPPTVAPILDFVLAVSYLFTASLACFCTTDAAWSTYCDWMRSTWRGNINEVISELGQHQERIGLPEEDAPDDDPREQLRQVIGYLEKQPQADALRRIPPRGPANHECLDGVDRQGDELSIKGTEMFWNNPSGSEAILQIRSATLSDDDRLVRLLTRRPGQNKFRRGTPQIVA